MSDETLREMNRLAREMYAMALPSTPEEMRAQGFTYRSEPLGGAAQALLEHNALGLREARELALCAARLLEANEGPLRGGCQELGAVAVAMLKRAKALLGEGPK